VEFHKPYFIPIPILVLMEERRSREKGKAKVLVAVVIHSFLIAELVGHLVVPV